MSRRLHSVTALVPEDVFDTLAPVAEQIGEALMASLTDRQRGVLLLLGNDPTVYGWGHLLTALARSDTIELDLITPDGVMPLVKKDAGS